jgi:hypothetical protein
VNKNNIFPAENSLKQEILSQQIQLLYAAVPASFVMAMINAFVLTYAQWSVIDHLILQLWLATVLVVYLLRGGMVFIYRHQAPLADDN